VEDKINQGWGECKRITQSAERMAHSVQYPTSSKTPYALRLALGALRESILLMLRGLIHKGADDCLEVGLVGAIIGGINVRDIHSVQDRFQNG